jgi:dihydroneopterin aldolase
MNPTPDTLRIELPELPCRIGVLEGENDHPQPVAVALTIEVDFDRVFETGALGDSVDYGPLHAGCVHLIRERRWTLLEGLARELLDLALAAGGVLAATVEVTKVSPPLGPDAGPVTLRARRERS